MSDRYESSKYSSSKYDTREYSTSKLGMLYDKKFILAHHKEYHNTLHRLRQLEGNKRCADCNSKGNNWCSVNICIFLCTNCAQIHRGVGIHISEIVYGYLSLTS